MHIGLYRQYKAYIWYEIAYAYAHVFLTVFAYALLYNVTYYTTLHTGVGKTLLLSLRYPYSGLLSSSTMSNPRII